jgi:hypothetical protein
VLREEQRIEIINVWYVVNDLVEIEWKVVYYVLPNVKDLELINREDTGQRPKLVC